MRDVPEFGDPGPVDLERPGAYAVTLNSRGELLIVLISPPPLEWYLPGGGIKEGEDPRQALRREVREETGLEVEVLREIGRANQRFKREGKYIHKLGIFFECRVGGGELGGQEPDHAPAWVDPRAAADKLPGFQGWAVKQLLTRHAP